jgi:hypothetical protein
MGFYQQQGLKRNSKQKSDVIWERKIVNIGIDHTKSAKKTTKGRSCEKKRIYQIDLSCRKNIMEKAKNE